MTQNPIMFGLGGTVFGAAIAALAMSQGGDLRKLEQEMLAMADSNSALAAEVASLSEQVGNVEASLATVTEANAGLGDTMTTAMADLSSAVAGSLSQTAAEQADALAAGLDEMRTMAATAGAAPAVAPTVSEAPATAAPVMSDPPAEGSPGIGQTATLADGAVRVFVSRVTDGSARVAMNGLEMINLSVGQSRGVQTANAYCRVTLDAVGDRQAGLSALCGDDLPPPSGSKIGETIQLADGAIRVFVSRLAPDESHAILAINGLDTTSLGFGEVATIEAEGTTCAIMVDSIDRGTVQLTESCG